MSEWRNWTGDQRCVPARIERPRDRGDLIESVKRAADQGLTVRARRGYVATPLPGARALRK